VDDLQGLQIAALLQEHLDNMALHSPPQSVHALDLHALRAPSVTFWSAWACAVLLGCAALKALHASHGEIKPMRTASRHLRKGVAAALLTHLIDIARQRDYARLGPRLRCRLCTGARALYAFWIRALRTICRLYPRPLQGIHDAQLVKRAMCL
jgi:GNAT superfamily N-acetyltransferase